MVIAIKAVVNYQTIISSIDHVQENIRRTKEHTDYINNFLTPYLNSEYAPYFLAHENNQLLPGETIIKIVVVHSGSIEQLSWTQAAVSTGYRDRISPPTPAQSWKKFVSDLTDDIVWKR